MKHLHVDIHPEVQHALDNELPVLALESTIISHGMPFPQNLETAILLEDMVREASVTPATIAIIDGKLKVGLQKSEIEYFAKEGKRVIKASRQDIPYLLTNKINGATTVAATMVIAELAGIKIFATGGIGGVHRGANKSFDISADLQELSNTNVAVVCSGIKAILDIPATLEYLETYGVPILGYQTDELPAFYARNSGHHVNYSVQSASEIAQLMTAKWQLGLNGGVVIANPIPKDQELEFSSMAKAIEAAILEEKELGIKGKNSTPFLLQRVKELTAGKSLEANVALVKNNVKLGCEIAKALKQK